MSSLAGVSGSRILAWAAFIATLSLSATRAHAAPAAAASIPAAHPSIFVRYQFEVDEILAMLKAAEGAPLDPKSTPARWLDEMGWRRWIRESSGKPFVLTQEMKTQLKAQEKFLRSAFSYAVGDAVWVPAEAGEQPYGHSGAKVNPRGQIARILRGEADTYFVVEVGVDNGSDGGMTHVDGKFYDGRPGKILSYGDSFRIEKKTYVYSLSEMERYNAPFRSMHVGSDTGAQVDYVRDAKWLAKMDAFKDKIIDKGLDIDFTAPAKEIYRKQRRLLVEMFRHFKMNRNAPGGAPLLGDVASGGGVCFTQACVLSHGVHAVGEPYGVRAMNISGTTINPQGGHGFVRLTIRGPEEVHVYDLAEAADGRQIFRGLEIKSNMLHYISDPGWADYGKTPDMFAAMPVEDAINPLPMDANRAIHELVQGRSFEEVIEKYGNKGPFVTNRQYKGALFYGSKQGEFLAPGAQIAEAAALEKALGSKLSALVDEAKTLKAEVLRGKAPSARAVKSRIYTDLVARNAGGIHLPGVSGEGIQVLLTEYLFRALR